MMEKNKKPAVWGRFLIAVLLLAQLTGCGTSGTNPSPNHENPSGSTGQPPANDTVQQPSDTGNSNTNQPTPEPSDTVKRQTVVLYFPDQQIMNLYREKQEVTYRTEQELPKDALEAWIKGPKSKRLTNILPASVKVEYVKDLGNQQAEVSFSRDIKNWNHGSTEEAMLAEAVPLILKPYGFKEVWILVEGKHDESVFSHMGADRPFQAKNPDIYKWVQE